MILGIENRLINFLGLLSTYLASVELKSCFLILDFPCSIHCYLRLRNYYSLMQSLVQFQNLITRTQKGQQ